MLGSRVPVKGNSKSDTKIVQEKVKGRQRELRLSALKERAGHLGHLGAQDDTGDTAVPTSLLLGIAVRRGSSFSCLP